MVLIRDPDDDEGRVAMSSIITVQLDAVESLAEELRLLSMELADDEDLCRTTARSFGSALDGDAGWEAAATATAWGQLLGIVGARTGAVATTLSAAVAAYRAADAALAAALAGDGTSGPAPR